MADNVTLLNSGKDFEATPEGWAKRWKSEIESAKKAVQKWQTNGDEIIRIFKAEAKNTGAGVVGNIPTRIPLYTGNVQTQRAMLYGETPQAAVDNRFYDPNDETARVAGEILERLLNDDLSHPKDTFQPCIGYSLDDYQLPGAGVMRWRYEAEFEPTEAKDAILGDDGEEQAPAVPAGEQKSYECAEAEYIHWRDFLWSPARTWLDVRWVGFARYLTKDDAKKNFGDKVAKQLPFSKGIGKDDKTRGEDAMKDDPWARVIIWELWSKEHRKVFWWCDGYKETLKIIDDPLELDGFFPMPEPLMANLTTSSFIPRPDYALAQDLYEEFDEVSYRARAVAKAIKVRGVYDAKNKALSRIMQEAFDQDLIPHENWGAFEKNGGIQGALQFLPIDMLAGVLEQLLNYRMQLKQLLDEVTGNGDVLRGAAASVGEEQTATETRSQVRFGSVRLKAKQMRFERFASEALSIKAEIIAKHYSPETIMAKSNMQQSFDAAQVPQALQMLKDKFWFYRVAVKPNSVSLRDMDAVKSERVQLLEALGQYMTTLGPILQGQPALAPMMLELLKASMSGFEAAKELEGIIDQGVEAMKQALANPPQPPAPPPDHSMQVAQIKAQADQQKVQMQGQQQAQQGAQEHQQRMQEIQAELAADITRQEAQAHWNQVEEMARQNLQHQHDQENAHLDHAFGQQNRAQEHVNTTQLQQSAPIQRPRGPRGS